MNPLFVSLCIPYFNEKDQIDYLVNDIINLDASSQNMVSNYIFIDDCSNDQTTERIKEKLQQDIKILSKCVFIKNDANIGFAQSVIKGLQNSNSEFSVEIPGDCEVLISKVLPKIKGSFDLLIFERYNVIKGRPIIRLLISYLFRTIMSIFFNTKLVDCNGIFAIKTKIIHDLNLSSKSFFLNAEIYAKCLSLKKNITIDKIEHEKKEIYKSSSLTIKQLYLLIIDFFNTLKFVYLKKK
jgi:glycosyltransferase involved in cell wall biosynthesis